MEHPEEKRKAVRLHIHLPFSYWRSADPATGVPLRRPEGRELAAYLNALVTELSSMKEDFDDCDVTAIRFLGGYMSLMDAEDFERLTAYIRRFFHVAPDCRMDGVLFPGSLDMRLLPVYRDHRAAPLWFEVPSLLFRECEAIGLSTLLQALDRTVYFLQSYQEENWGLRLHIGAPGRTENQWKSTLGELYHYDPPHVEFVSDDPGVREHPAFYEICDEWEAHGHKKVAPLLYSSSEELLIPPLANDAEFIGAGLGAISHIDGFETRSTTDISWYMRHCGDYRELLKSVTEL